MNHKQYTLSNLTFEDNIKLLTEAYSICDKWWVDILNSNSCFRTKIEMTFEEAILKCNDKDYFTLFYRVGMECISEPDYYEFGFTTSACKLPTYYLWIFTTVENGNKLIDKYNINELTL